MIVNSTVADQSVLTEFGIDISAIKFMKPGKRRARYLAIVNWLTKYKAEPGSSALRKVKGYIETLNNLCVLKEWETIQLVLYKQIFINSNVSLPLYEYLLYRKLNQELRQISEEILDFLQETENNLDFVLMLKARALSDISDKLEDARKLFEELFINSEEGTEIKLESLIYLGIRQVNSGSYQEGIKSLTDALTTIESNQDFLSNLKIQELKTNILENIALYEMNSSHFHQAIKLYKDVIRIRRKLGSFHRVIHSSTHLGIIMRKIGKYEQARYYLSEAKESAKSFNNENQIIWINHHLAFTLLNEGEAGKAEKLCINSLAGYKKIDDRRGESDCYEQLGLINLAMKRYDNAEINFKKALNIRQYIGNLHGTASSTLDLALTSWHQRKFMNAAYFLLKGFYLYYKLGVLSFTRFRRMIKLSFEWTLGKRRWTM